MTRASTARLPSRATSTPTARGTCQRSSRVAAADSGMAITIVTSTASISVASWRKSRPNSSRPAASSTAR